MEYGISLLVYLVPATIVNHILERNPDDAGLLGLVYIPLFWILLAQGAKRCHDLGKNGWWQIIPFFSFALLFIDGEPGSNEYGENPKGIKSIYE